MQAAIKGESEYVRALRDINLEVQEDEVPGIIGKNVAGKNNFLNFYMNNQIFHLFIYIFATRLVGVAKRLKQG